VHILVREVVHCNSSRNCPAAVQNNKCKRLIVDTSKIYSSAEKPEKFRYSGPGPGR